MAWARVMQEYGKRGKRKHFGERNGRPASARGMLCFSKATGLILLKVQVAAPWEPVARDWMADEEEGDGFGGHPAVLAPLMEVAGQPSLPQGGAPMQLLLTPLASTGG